MPAMKDTAVGSKPDPDPTTRTIEMVLREIEHRDDLVNAKLETVASRFAAMDKGITLLQAFADKSPTTAAVASYVDALRELLNEKLAGVKERFAAVERLNQQQETSVENTRRDVKLAIDAAFNAAKEGVTIQDKNTGEKISEIKAAFTKQIDQMSLLNQTEIKAINDKLDDAKGRLQIIESRANGTKEGIGMIGAIVLGAFGVLGTLTAVAALIFAVTRRTV